jgi:hypothetical protein
MSFFVSVRLLNPPPSSSPSSHYLTIFCSLDDTFLQIKENIYSQMREKGAEDVERYNVVCQELFLATDLLGDHEKLSEWQLCCGEMLFLRLRE